MPAQRGDRRRVSGATTGVWRRGRRILRSTASFRVRVEGRLLDRSAEPGAGHRARLLASVSRARESGAVHRAPAERVELAARDGASRPGAGEVGCAGGVAGSACAYGDPHVEAFGARMARCAGVLGAAARAVRGASRRRVAERARIVARRGEARDEGNDLRAGEVRAGVLDGALPGVARRAGADHHARTACANGAFRRVARTDVEPDADRRVELRRTAIRSTGGAGAKPARGERRVRCSRIEDAGVVRSLQRLEQHGADEHACGAQTWRAGGADRRGRRTP